MKTLERIVYYGIFVVGMACAFALFTRQLGPHSYNYFALGLLAAFGIAAGLWKAYDDATR